MEVVGVCKPQGMSYQPTLQPVDLILVNQALRIERQHMRAWLDLKRYVCFVPIFYSASPKGQIGVTLECFPYRVC